MARTKIEKFSTQMAKSKEKTSKLLNQATVFKLSKCKFCSRDLTLPSVHFLCGCSFHKHCFTTYCENEKECPVCEKENKKVLSKLNRAEKQITPDQFTQQLSRSSDGFSTMIDMLSRGEISLFQPEKSAEPEPDEDFSFGLPDSKASPSPRPVASNKLLANRAKIAAKLKSQAMSASTIGSLQSNNTDLDVQNDFFRRESTTSARSIESAKNPFDNEPEEEEEATVTESSNPFGDDNEEDDDSNPFGPVEDATDSVNPFDEQESSNPFGEPEDEPPANPFGDEEEEFDETNPFA